jgi:hypothetical protein
MHWIERRGKTVAPFRNNFDVLGCRGSSSKRFSKGKDMNREISLFNDGVWPDDVQQIILRNYSTGIPYEDRKDFQSLRRNFQ